MNMNNTNGTENIKAGQIWWNITNNTAIRITNIIPCTGVWGVTADGEGDCDYDSDCQCVSLFVISHCLRYLRSGNCAHDVGSSYGVSWSFVRFATR